LEENPYLIKTKIRLIIVICFFSAGPCLYDLVIIHGVSYVSVFNSVWGVVDVINKNTDLKFRFPTKEEQLKIVKGFESLSGAGIDRVIGGD
jgi:hypothetical protein